MEEVKMRVYGEAYYELSDQPYFEKLMMMEQDLIRELETQLADVVPEQTQEYALAAAYRAGAIKGMKELQACREYYKSVFLETEKKDGRTV